MTESNVKHYLTMISAELNFTEEEKDTFISDVMAGNGSKYSDQVDAKASFFLRDKFHEIINGNGPSDDDILDDIERNHY